MENVKPIKNQVDTFEGEFKNRYFTPSIEDIRVGYECECLWCCQEPRPWVPITITKEDNMDTKSLPFGIEVVWRLEEGEIRVPYLTKEQIEAEGWVLAKQYSSKVWNFEKDNYFLAFYEDSRVIILMAKDVTKLDWLWLHQGDNFYHSQAHLFRMTFPCKCINTFRYICKLLNIK